MGQGLGSKGQCGRVREVGHADEPGAFCIYEEQEAHSAGQELCKNSCSARQCVRGKKGLLSIECSPCHSNLSLSGAIFGIWDFQLILQRLTVFFSRWDDSAAKPFSVK